MAGMERFDATPYIGRISFPSTRWKRAVFKSDYRGLRGSSLTVHEYEIEGYGGDE